MIESSEIGLPVTGGHVSVIDNSVGTLLNTTISPDSGGGSSGSVSGGTPATLANSTPPNSPLRGGVVRIGGEEDIPRFSFSPKTCLEILPTLSHEQLKFEIQYMNITTTDTDKESCINAIRKELSKIVCMDFTDKLNTITNTISSFSYLVDRAESVVQKLVSQCPPVTESPEPAADVVSELPEPVTPQVDDSVCKIYDDLFADLKVEEILNQITFDTHESYGRKTAYFGKVGYSYGRVKHSSAPYPNCPVFSRVLTGMRDLVPEFSFDDYTCLVTHYPDGKSQIPLHHDDEAQIVEGSSIYTISVGSDRFFTLQNQVGLLNEAVLEIKHGSVYSMSRESQGTWKHGMLPQDSSEPRISFGFRRLIPEAQIPQRERAPPITHPDKYRSPNAIPSGSHERCLLLTDSILAPAPATVFSRADHLRCIKKNNKRLVDIFNFEPEFGICNTVILSAGVNDLSCYGHTARPLADVVCGRLRRVCQKHPRTKFIFNSVLNVHNDMGWLNEEINIFNRYMYELSLTVPNMAFFDSHSILMKSQISQHLGGVIDLDDRRGVHITWGARKLIIDNLVKAVELTSLLSGGKSLTNNLRNWQWPMRNWQWRVDR